MKITIETPHGNVEHEISDDLVEKCWGRVSPDAYQDLVMSVAKGLMMEAVIKYDRRPGIRHPPR